MNTALNLDTISKHNPILPVLTLAELAMAIPLATALNNAGVNAIEITLRSPVALDAIRAVRTALPDIIVGAGTVRSADDFAEAIRAGARFIVSPGSTRELLDAADHWDVPFLPGAATASELMLLADRGYRHVKFFPAHALGGVTAIGAFGGPFPDLRFCPSGGIDARNFKDYLALANVPWVSGSWLTPADKIAKGQWQLITDVASQTLSELSCQGS